MSRWFMLSLLVTGSNAVSPCKTSQVTCCFTIDNALQKVYVDDKDITELVEPQAEFTNWQVAKTVTFAEPFLSATLAIQGYDYDTAISDSTNSGLKLSCSSTRPGSPWNFVSEPGSNWTSVAPVGYNAFPDNWQENGFPGPVSPVTTSTAVFDLDSQTCESSGLSASTLARATKVAASVSSNGMFSFRRTVIQDAALASCTAASLPGPSQLLSQTETCGKVTCCLTVFNFLTNVSLNGIDMTSQIVPDGEFLLDWTKTKTITFDEPPGANAVLAILGWSRDDSSSPDASGLQVICTSTRSNSIWSNLVSDPSSGTWFQVPIQADGAPPSQWNLIDYSGPMTPAVASTSKFFIREPVCGPLDRFRKVASDARSDTPFFAIRANLAQSNPCTPSNPPTVAPTIGPLSIELDFSATVDSSAQSTSKDEGGWGGSSVQTVSSVSQTALMSAGSWWQRAVVQSLPSRVCIDASTQLCGFTFSSQQCVEDILIMIVSDPALSSRSETMICAVDTTGRPRVARIALSPSITDSTLLARTALHALTHALGFGTSWDEYNLLNANQTFYIGTYGVEQYSQSIPVETLVHWDNNALGGELMTAEYSSTSALSKITLGAMKDLRYDVDMSQAEAYSFNRRLVDDKRSLASSEAMDVILLSSPLVLSSIVKPGRQSDYQSDVTAKQARDQIRSNAKADGTAANGGSVLSLGGIIGIAVGGGLAIVALVALLVIRLRRASLSARPPSSRPSPFKKTPPKHGWIEKFDGENNTTYWINRDTGEFSWTNPIPSIASPPSSRPPTTSEIVMAQPDFSTKGDEEEITSPSKAVAWQETVVDDNVESDARVRYFIKPATGEFQMTMPSSRRQLNFELD